MCKVSKNGVKFYEELRSQGTHCLYIEVEKWLSSQSGKSDKKLSNNYIQTTCTYRHTMKKISAKFQKDQYKTVREVALTRHPG